MVSTPEFSTKNRWFLRVVSTVVLVVRYDPSYMLRSVKDAILLEKKGCFSIVLEKIPNKIAKKVSQKIQIPTIGIGAGNNVDGQVLVTHDMLGMTQDFNPRFIRRYANLNKEISKACKNYIKDVKANKFPNSNESY